MKKVIHWVGLLTLIVGLIPEILLLIGVLEIGVASLSNLIGIDPTWFEVSSNMWVRMVTLAGNGDARIIASFGFVLAGIMFLVISDGMRYSMKR